ncbi:MAG TPA: hypothetical protein VEE84_03665 [Burkholderiaceae bacterium]|nr:hypothetical protein [Burkholderiaceae bacterium]
MAGTLREARVTAAVDRHGRYLRLGAQRVYLQHEPLSRGPIANTRKLTMDKIDEQRELDVVRQIVQIRVVMNRHDLTFEQAAAVLQLSVLHEMLRNMTPQAS